MAYKRYKMLQKYINGVAQEEYKQGELISNYEYETFNECNDGNQKPDEDIEDFIYQWVVVSGTYICNNSNKYQMEKEQRSSDNGATWQDTGRTRQGALIEVNSEDCNYANQYLTFVALENGTFSFTQTQNNIQYSLDNGSTWTTLAAESSTPTVTIGNKIMWKAENLTFSPSSPMGIGTFSSTGRYDVEGNIMSLLYGDNFIGQTDLTEKIYVFYYLFKNNANVVNAANLILPATTLAQACYELMFQGCTSLVTAPELPATTLEISCYFAMFGGCTSLVAAPVLPATTLANWCYRDMFYDCTSLVNAPVLPATTLANYCYGGMFSGCTSLTTAPNLPSTTLAEYCYSSMFYGCTSLVTAPVLPATTLAYRCYMDMFVGCTSLVNAPVLPATTLANECYGGMFARCTSLVTAPELPATTLANECYGNMFVGCTSLVNAPELPATILTDKCYRFMFYNCSNLNFIKCLATDITANNCTYLWLLNTSSSGTFVKASSMTSWTTGENGIPSGWTVQDAST